MRPIATDGPVAGCVSQFVSLTLMRLRCSKTDERIDVLFGMETVEDSRQVVLDGGSGLPTSRGSADGAICKK